MKMSTRWIYIVVLLGVFTLGLCRKTAETCLTSADPSTLTLTCEENKMIHVLSEQYQQADRSCQVLPQGCATSRHNFQTGLFAICNGHQTCNATVTNFNLRTACVDTVEATIATVTYECLTGGEDICSPFTKTTDRVLGLMSPNFPRLAHPSFCSCEVTGTSMSVEILTVRFPGFPQNGVSLNITGDNSTVSVGPYAFNEAVFEKTVSSLKLDFDGNSTSNQHVWMNIVAPSSIRVTCNRDAATATDTTLWTTTVPSSSNAAKPTARDETEAAPVAGIIVGAIGGCIILVIVVVIVVAVVVKKRQNDDQAQHNTQSNSDGQRIGGVHPGFTGDRGDGVQNESSETPNTYSSLRHYENTDADHDYRRLQTYGNIDQGERSQGTSTYSGHPRKNAADDHDYSQLEK